MVTHTAALAFAHRAPQPARRRARLHRRMSLGEISIALLMAVALTASLPLFEHQTPAEVGSYVTVSVAEGGTLWEIAVEHPIPGRAIEEVVALIRSANALDSSLIYAGQVLRVPTADVGDPTLAAR